MDRPIKHVGEVVDDSVNEGGETLIEWLRKQLDSERAQYATGWRISFRAGVVAGFACSLFVCGTLTHWYSSDKLYPWLWGVGASIALIDVSILEVRRHRDAKQNAIAEKAWAQHMDDYDRKAVERRMERLRVAHEKRLAGKIEQKGEEV